VHAAASGLGLKLSDEELSKLARRGSGSAARSIFGGFVEMRAGGGDCDGADSFATPILAAREWPLSVVIAITDVGAKSVGSSRGMQTSAETSPYYARWIDASGEDLGSARAAIAGRDFAALAALSEHSCLKMHAVAMAGKPPLIYWNAATLSCIAAVRELQREGAPVFFTIDAGPQVKAVCLPEAEQRVATALRGLPGVLDIIVTGLGPGVQSL
jgi:diphosphomevalonate decarboxylase